MQNDQPLIPRKILFDNPDRTQARLSPDGKRLSFLAPLNGVLNVWVSPTLDPAQAEPVTNDSGRGIHFHGWAYTNRHLFYMQDKNGDENWRIYCVDVEQRVTTDLTPYDGVQARIQQVSDQSPEEILIALNDRLPQLHDLYRLNFITGERQLVVQNEGFLGFLTDDGYRVRLAARMNPDGGEEWQRSDGAGGWQPFLAVPMEDNLTTRPVGLDKEGNRLYWVDSRERNTSALFEIDLATGDTRLLSANERVDCSEVLQDPSDHHVQAVCYNHLRKVWQVLDAAIAEDFAYLATVVDGDFNIAYRTPDDQQWIVAYEMDNGPARYYRYQRNPASGQRQATFLFSDRQALAGQPLAHMHPVIIPTRDGLEMVCYFTLPLGSEQKTGHGVRPRQPMAMVLLVHGGPWWRDSWGYDSFHQWLANRGYAVLSVNFRSSTGFGKEFINAGNCQWGAKMHDDLVDAVHWAIAEGIADPTRVAIAGGSYGGYATLAGLTMTPDLFACGVDIVGPSNLVTLLETIPPYWEPGIASMTKRLGDHRSEEGRAFLASRSPLTYADRIQRPLLIGQGANDPRVKQNESDQIVQAMQANGIPVTYVLYPDEGHGFARPENNLSFNAIMEAFLAQHLEERFEPIGDDFANSSLTVPTGQEQVAGLTEKLGS